MIGGADAIPGLKIRWHHGDRAVLRRLFELADDSPRQLDGYIELGRILVAVDEGLTVGHLQLVDGDSAGEVELRSLAVGEDRWRRGIGGALVERAVAECRAEGARTLLVATAAADVRNLRFYQLLGFRMLRVERDAFTVEDGYPEDLTIDGIPLRDRVWLSLSLQGR
jgi:N-acetylglutamate synthase-like GNAT family acetyltransferase